MIFKLFIITTFFLLTFSCSSGKHRYLVTSEIFDSKEYDSKRLGAISEIFGKPTKKITLKGTEHLFRSINKTPDTRYSVAMRDGKVSSFILIPSELTIHNALKIFSHFKLNKSSREIPPAHHVVGQEFFFRTKDKSLEIKSDEQGRVEWIVWNSPSSRSIATGSN